MELVLVVFGIFCRCVPIGLPARALWKDRSKAQAMHRIRRGASHSPESAEEDENGLES